MKGKPKPLLVIALILAAIVLYLAVFFIVRGVPEGSYVRTSGMGAPTWHFQLEEDITDMYVRHSYYKDGEFITYGEGRYDTDRLLSYSLDIGWEDVSLRHFRMEETAKFTPSLRHFAWTYSFGTKEKQQTTMVLHNQFPDIEAEYHFSALRSSSPIPVKKGVPITLMNIAFGDCVPFELDRDLALNPAHLADLLEDDVGNRIVIEAYFE
ncbi:MAG: hypothetical protein IJA33_02535 [Oscillospiraceae bacterium]|nr:hypothetical protein [Oscillospiraceae bacterium]